jgi:RHS repeat-associated protein
MRGEDSLQRTTALWPGALPATNRVPACSRDASGEPTSTRCSGDACRRAKRTVLIAAGIEPGGETPPLQSQVSALGSLGGVTQNAGGLYSDQLYYPWGQFWTYQVLKHGPQFAGMERVEPYASDTYPTPNRIYSGNYGRWLSPDPLGGDVTNPQSLNRYGYVMNNPTSSNDPLGLDEDLNPGDVYCSGAGAIYAGSNGKWGDPNGCTDANSGNYPPGGFKVTANDKLTWLSETGGLSWGFWWDPFGAMDIGSKTVTNYVIDVENGDITPMGWQTFTVYGSGFDASLWLLAQNTSGSGTGHITVVTKPGSTPPPPTRLQQASKAAVESFVIGEGFFGVVGCVEGGAIGVGATAETGVLPLAGTGAVAGCVGGASILALEAVPASTGIAAITFAWHYWHH